MFGWLFKALAKRNLESIGIGRYPLKLDEILKQPQEVDKLYRYSGFLRKHYQQSENPRLRDRLSFFQDIATEVLATNIHRIVFAKVGKIFNNTVGASSSVIHLPEIEECIIRLPYLHRNEITDCWTFAHELGHIALRPQIGLLKDRKNRHLMKKIETFILNDVLDEESESVPLVRNISYEWLTEFAADEFAAIIMGPSYALYFSSPSDTYWVSTDHYHHPCAIRLYLIGKSILKHAKNTSFDSSTLSKMRDKLEKSKVDGNLEDAKASIIDSYRIISHKLDEYDSTLSHTMLDSNLLEFIYDEAVGFVKSLNVRPQYDDMKEFQETQLDMENPAPTRIGLAAYFDQLIT